MKNKLGRRVNTKAQTMFEQEEKQVNPITEEIIPNIN